MQAASPPEAGASLAPAPAASTSDAGKATTEPSPPASPATTPPAPDTGKALSIAQLRRLKPTSGTHTIEGFIIRVAPCPPCPEGAVCKPCMGDHVVVSDGPQALEGDYRLGNRDVIVFVPRATQLGQLAVGQRHRLTLLVRPEKTTSLPINDLELIELRP